MSGVGEHNRTSHDEKTVAEIKAERRKLLHKVFPIVLRALLAIAIGLFVGFIMPMIVKWLAGLPVEVWAVTSIVIAVIVASFLQIFDDSFRK